MRRHRASLGRLIIIAGLLLLALTPGAKALTAAGDANDLWVVQPNAERAITLLHRLWNDDPSRVEAVASLEGRLSPNGLAAAGGRAWLVYDNMSVQSITTVTVTDARLPRYDQPTMEAPLPRVAAVLAFTATKDGPWALVRIEDAATLLQVDATQPSDTQPASQPVTTQAAATLPAATQPVRELRLLRLDRGRWAPVPLPADWPIDGRMFLVVADPDDAVPCLLRVDTGEEGDVLRIEEMRDKQWTTRRVKLDGTIDSPVIAVGGQLLFARSGVTDQKLDVELLAVRGEGTLSLGRASLPDAAGKAWTLVASGETAAVISGDGADSMQWVRLDLSGRPAEPAGKLAVASPRVGVDALRVSIQMIMLAVALLIMFVVWRRDGGIVVVKMPAGYVEADVFRRLFAAVIDLIPCVLAVWFFLRVPLDDVAAHWPGTPVELKLQLPGLVIILLYAIHTFFSELFTATTLGKRAVGLRVASIDGTPPNVWQVAGRCALKVFEFVAWPLLILPLFRPYGQRLGDSVARTVVVMPRQEEDHSRDS
ncbi:MAG: RDD family protein [Planctomycetes bacterium]|nr:RDD family protein [Planctomycetota bacterium]